MLDNQARSKNYEIDVMSLRQFLELEGLVVWNRYLLCSVAWRTVFLHWIRKCFEFDQRKANL